MTPKIMIILGSGSDIAIAEKSMNILEKLEIPYSLKIASAHRTPNLIREIVKRVLMLELKSSLELQALQHTCPVQLQLIHQDLLSVFRLTLRPEALMHSNQLSRCLILPLSLQLE